MIVEMTFYNDSTYPGYSQYGLKSDIDAEEIMNAFVSGENVRLHYVPPEPNDTGFGLHEGYVDLGGYENPYEQNGSQYTENFIVNGYSNICAKDENAYPVIGLMSGTFVNDDGKLCIGFYDDQRR